MKDDYNVARYIPKKYWNNIDEIILELDFDNRSNRTLHRYYIYFKDGSYISEIGIKGIVNKIKNYLALSPSGKAQDFDSCIRWFKSNKGCFRRVRC